MQAYRLSVLDYTNMNSATHTTHRRVKLSNQVAISASGTDIVVRVPGANSVKDSVLYFTPGILGAVTWTKFSDILCKLLKSYSSLSHN